MRSSKARAFHTPCKHRNVQIWLRSTGDATVSRFCGAASHKNSEAVCARNASSGERCGRRAVHAQTSQSSVCVRPLTHRALQHAPARPSRIALRSLCTSSMMPAESRCAGAELPLRAHADISTGAPRQNARHLLRGRTLRRRGPLHPAHGVHPQRRDGRGEQQRPPSARAGRRCWRRQQERSSASIRRAVPRPPPRRPRAAAQGKSAAAAAAAAAAPRVEQRLRRGPTVPRQERTRMPRPCTRRAAPACRHRPSQLRAAAPLVSEAKTRAGATPPPHRCRKGALQERRRRVPRCHQ